MNDLLPDSSVVERVPVKRVVAGSSPARAAKPMVPICYETACKALAECLSLDEAKLWDGKAEALAAWAKIYHDDDAARKARALKLHAYRRMGQLSKELTKDRPRFDANGPVPGARALLINEGLKVNDADACIRLAKAPTRLFEKAVNSPRPPSPSYFMQKERDTDLSDIALSVKRAFVEARPFVKSTTVPSVVNGMNKHDREKLGELLLPVYEWLDEFMQRVRK